jgi:hypothetical protein
MAAKHNLAIKQGATFTQNIVVKNAAGTVIDLTGYTGRAHLRLEYTTDEYTAFTVTIPSPTDGTINLSLTAAQTEALEPERHVYDVELVSGATVHRVVQGNATVYPEVTKAE